MSSPAPPAGSGVEAAAAPLTANPVAANGDRREPELQLQQTPEEAHQSDLGLGDIEEVELLVRICSFLAPKDLGRLARVSASFGRKTGWQRSAVGGRMEQRSAVEETARRWVTARPAEEQVWSPDGSWLWRMREIQRPRWVIRTAGITGVVNWKDEAGHLMFHFNGRANEAQIVMNTHRGGWGPEERIPFPLCDVTVRATDVGYEVWWEGELRHTYRHRITWSAFAEVETSQPWRMLMEGVKSDQMP